MNTSYAVSRCYFLKPDVASDLLDAFILLDTLFQTLSISVSLLEWGVQN
jgi:hypothetical protein